MKNALFAGMLVAITLTSAAPASAHHSIALWFDMTKQETLEGTVVALNWTNPHAVLQFEVKQPDGSTNVVSAETRSPVGLSRAGWKRGMFKPGELITVTVSPSRTGRPDVYLRQVKTADGRVYDVSPPPSR